jgi:hypothetical protein
MNIAMNTMKAQSGMEYAMIFGFSLIILTVLWSYSSSNIEDTRWDLQVAYARSALNKIAEISDIVYVQGEPSGFYIYPNFPDNVGHAYVGTNSLTLELRWKNGVLRNITVDTAANLTGTISNAGGTHKLYIGANGSLVQISEV